MPTQELDLADLSPLAKARLQWLLQARPQQLTPPGWGWVNWLLRAGRGYGKTRCGAEDLLHFCAERPYARMAVVAPTFALGRDVCFEGESGVLQLCPGSEIDKWNRSEGLFIMKNGAQAKVYSAEEPERLRGPQHHRAWVEELCAADPGQMPLTWMNLKLGLRLPMPVGRPQCVITSTLKPSVLIKRIMNDPMTVQTHGRTMDNAANLSKEAVDELVEMYGGTRVGRQELEGELVEDVEGAMWQLENLYNIQLRYDEIPGHFDAGCVAIDPAVTFTSESDETGIIGIGGTLKSPRKAFVMADWSGRYPPEECARLAYKLCEELGFSVIVYEKNQGGEYIRRSMQAYVDTLPIQERPHVRLVAVNAVQSKELRAEPISIRYESTPPHIFHVQSPRPSRLVQGKMLFELAKLEQQMTTWVPRLKGQDSADRVDALVHGLTHLLRGSVGQSGSSAAAMTRQITRRPLRLA